MNDDSDEDSWDEYETLVEQREQIETQLEHLRKRIDQEVTIVPAAPAPTTEISDPIEACDAFLFDK